MSNLVIIIIHTYKQIEINPYGRIKQTTNKRLKCFLQVTNPGITLSETSGDGRATGIQDYTNTQTLTNTKEWQRFCIQNAIDLIEDLHFENDDRNSVMR